MLKVIKTIGSCFLCFCLILSISALALALASEGNVDQDGSEGRPPSSVSGNAVGLDGSFTYDFPLSVPPGTDGIEPNLALVYNSNAGNGNVGVGWGLSGIGSITRRGKWGGVPKYDGTDVFYWNGQKLIRDPNATGYLYHTERESYARIKASGDPATGTGVSWYITTTDGTQYWFGSDDANCYSKINTIGLTTNHTHTWLLDHVRNTNQHTMKFYYSGDGVNLGKDLVNGDYYIKYIKYYLLENQGERQIIFNYEGRSDTNLSYRTGSKVLVDKRLKTIVTKMGSFLVNKYVLEYDSAPDTARSRLKKITTCGNDSSPSTLVVDGTSMPPVEFVYQTHNTKSYTQSDEVWTPPLESVYTYDTRNVERGVRYVDVNGDGLVDVVQNEKVKVFDHVDAVFNKKAYLNTGEGWADQGSQSPWIPPLEVSYLYMPTEFSSDQGVRFVDINGDGLVDIVQNLFAKGEDGLGRSFRKAFLNNGNGWTDQGSSSPWIPPPLITWWDYTQGSIDHGVRFVDLNGDGLVDIVERRENLVDGTTYQVSNVYLNNGNGWTQQPANSPWQIPAAIVCWEYDQPWQDIGQVFDKGVRFVDLNGDGLVDILQSYRWAFSGGHGYNTYSYAYLNNGNGWTEVNFHNWVDPISPGRAFFTYYFDDGSYTRFSLDQGVRFADVNGDGLVDMVQNMTRSYAGGTEEWKYCWINTGQGLRLNSNWIPPRELVRWENDGAQSQGLDYGVEVYDLNGDGLDDFIQGLNGPSSYGPMSFHAWLNNGSVGAENISEVKYPYGGKTEVHYQAQIQPNNQELSFNPVVVASLVNDDGLNTDYSRHPVYYHYYWGKYKGFTDKNGNGSVADPGECNREFRGFAFVRECDPGKNLKETRYYQDDVQKGLVKAVITRDKTGKAYDFTKYYYKDYTNPTFGYTTHCGYGITGVHAPLPDCIDNYAIDGATAFDTEINPYFTLRTVFRYQDYGFIDTISEYDYWEDSNELISSARTLYNVNTDYWVVVPKETYVRARDANGNWVDHSKQRFYYDDQGLGIVNEGKLTRTCTFKNSSSAINEYYGYNNYGILNYIKDGNGNITSTVYDYTYQVYPIKTTSTFNSYYYYDNHGYTGDDLNAISNNITIGRLSISRDWNNCFTKTYYDALGRVTMIVSPGDNEAYPTTKNEYYMDGIAPDYTVTKARIDPGMEATLDIYTYLDGFGRVVEVKTEGLDNGTPKWITTDHWEYYDENYHLIKETSAPYFADNNAFSRLTNPSQVSAKGTKTGYYLSPTEGKVSYTENPSGSKRYSYNKHLVVTERNEKNYGAKSYLDVLGNVIKTEVYSDTYPFDTVYSTTTFEYNYGNGQLIKKTDHAGNVTTYGYDWLGRKTSMIDPNAGTWSYGYDNNGNLTAQTDALGQTITMEYDSLNRLKKVDYPTGTDTIYSYDDSRTTPYPWGKLTRVYDSSGATSFWYDARGRITAEIRWNNGFGSFQTSYTYDSLDRVATITYPDGEVVKNTYDSAGNLQSVGTPSDPDKYVKNIKYNAFGQKKEIIYGNNVSTKYDYSGPVGNYRLSVLRVTPVTGQFLQYSYLHDAVGNIRAINSAYSEYGRGFTYDFANRLLTQSNSSAYGNATYSYDPLNRITSKNGVTYTYSGINVGPHAVTSTSNGKNFTYDANGNMTSVTESGITTTYAYDYNNRLVSVSGNESATYTYDYAGNRFKKVENGSATYYFNQFYEVEDGTVIKYYYADGQLVAQNKSGNLTFYHLDHIGNPNKLTDVNGLVIRNLGYMPYGTEAFSTGSGEAPKYKFTGKEEDSTGLYYFGARYYDPELGRFISPDNLGDNYTYCRNNPVRMIDPDGNSPLEFLQGAYQAIEGGLNWLHDTGLWWYRSYVSIGRVVCHNEDYERNMNYYSEPGTKGYEDTKFGYSLMELIMPFGFASKASSIEKGLSGLSKVNKYLPAVATDGLNSAVMSFSFQGALKDEISLKMLAFDSVVSGISTIPLKISKEAGTLALPALGRAGAAAEQVVGKLATNPIYQKLMPVKGANHATNLRMFAAGSTSEFISTPLRSIAKYGMEAGSIENVLATGISLGLGRGAGFGVICGFNMYAVNRTMGRTVNKYVKELVKNVFMQ
jgi:RHS repeat-associated protein